MVRVEFVGPDGQLLGLFFTERPAEEFLPGVKISAFPDTPGEWVPAGGVPAEKWWELDGYVGSVGVVD